MYATGSQPSLTSMAVAQCVNMLKCKRRLAGSVPSHSGRTDIAMAEPMKCCRDVVHKLCGVDFSTRHGSTNAVHWRIRCAYSSARAAAFSCLAPEPLPFPFDAEEMLPLTSTAVSLAGR
jgi:hypothetical protein